TAFDKSNIPLDRGSAPPSNCQHVRADIDSGNAPIRRDSFYRPQRDRAGPCAKVEHVLAGLEISPFYDMLDNRPEALIDLANIDRYHPIPDVDLPGQPFGILLLIHLCLHRGRSRGV